MAKDIGTFAALVGEYYQNYKFKAHIFTNGYNAAKSIIERDKIKPDVVEQSITAGIASVVAKGVTTIGPELENAVLGALESKFVRMAGLQEFEGLKSGKDKQLELQATEIGGLRQQIAEMKQGIIDKLDSLGIKIDAAQKPETGKPVVGDGKWTSQGGATQRGLAASVGG